MQTDRLCSIQSLARRLRRLGVTRKWIQAEVDASRIPCLRIKNRLIFDADVVEQVLLARAAEPAEAGT